MQTTEITVNLPFSYMHIPRSAEGLNRHGLSPSSPNPLVLFFHGYSDSANSLLHRLNPSHQWPYDIWSANGPFPLPIITGREIKESYGWYFINENEDKVFIPPSLTIEMIKTTLKKQNLFDREIVLVGFSQGGFLAPRLAHHLPHVKMIIGLGCGYQLKDYKGLSIPVHAIHGDKDQIIPVEKSRAAFEELPSSLKREYHIIPGLEHKMNSVVGDLVTRLILSEKYS